MQQIANENGGTRTSGKPGYAASATYVANKLRQAGYQVRQQRFDFPYYEVLAQSFSQTEPDQRTFEPFDFATGDGDFDIMTYSGNGRVNNALVVPTKDVQIPPSPQPSSTSGCQPGDFVDVTAVSEPRVALIQRGGCDFVVKAQNAEARGYDAAVIFNEGQPNVPGDDRVGVVLGTLGEPGTNIPVIGISFALGEEFYEQDQAGDVRVSLNVRTLEDVRSTTNVIADTTEGEADRTVVVGAHLDSVPEGPGINDNGSGTATDLEVALQMAKLGIEPNNKVRFAFWGAEEFGLLGSEYYVANLSEEQLQQIALNLNFDMLGSPNYVRFVYDGDGSATPDAGPAGSAQIEQLFRRYFAAKGLATRQTAFDGRSDYGPFIDAGIPAGGLFSGAEDIKGPEEAEIFGGTAGEAYDPCYHQACDDIANLNVRSLNEMSDAVAHATLTTAQDEDLFVGRSNLEARSSGESNFEYKGSRAIK